MFFELTPPCTFSVHTLIHTSCHTRVCILKNTLPFHHHYPRTTFKRQVIALHSSYPFPFPYCPLMQPVVHKLSWTYRKASHTPGAIHWNEIKIMSMTPSINIDIVSSEQDNCFVLWVSIQCAYIALRSNVWATNRRVIMSNTGRDSSLATSA